MDNFYKYYNLYNYYISVFIFAKVGKREDAEEILQDTWLSIYDSLPLFRNDSSFLTWAKSIAQHEIADFYRRRKLKTFVFSHLPFVANLMSQALGPELQYEKEELKKELEKVLNNLSEGYGEILRLKYIEGRTVVEMAKLWKLSEKAVESRLFRARMAFQKAWCAIYPNEPLKYSSLLLLKRAI